MKKTDGTTFLFMQLKKKPIRKPLSRRTYSFDN